MLTEKEMACLKSQLLGRLATVAADGQPNASAISFKLDDGFIHISGRKMESTRKYMRIRPTISWSWNVEGPSFVDGRYSPHRTVRGNES